MRVKGLRRGCCVWEVTSRANDRESVGITVSLHLGKYHFRGPKLMRPRLTDLKIFVIID